MTRTNTPQKFHQNAPKFVNDKLAFNEIWFHVLTTIQGRVRQIKSQLSVDMLLLAALVLNSECYVNKLD